MKTNFAPALFLALSIALPGGALAQIESVIVKKGYGYIQSGPATVALDPASNNYGFSADVNGVNVAGITPAPTVTGPINVAGLGAIHNNGRLVYSTGDHGWRWGNPNANDFGTNTLASLNSFFGSGVYTITVNGVAVALNLTGDAYPNAPVVTLSGGTWSGGKYVIDANQPLTVTTNAFTAYGSHPDDQICAGVFGPGFDKPFVEVGPFGCAFLQVHQYHSQVPGSNTASFTIPARTLQSGKDYVVGAGFEAMVDVKPLAALPGSINAAVYDVFTVATVSVTGGPAQVSNGQLAGSFSTGDGLVTFSCFGSPTCTGIFTRSGKDQGCSNSITFSDTLVMTGVILDPPGAIRGTFSVSNGTESQHNGDGTCTYTRPPHVDVFNYSGSWDGRSGTFTITFVDDNGQTSSANGTFTGTATVTAVPPVFPITVTGSVTPTVSNVSATFTPRAQDVGTSQKTFVFALVPATAIPHAVLSKDTHLGLAAIDAVKDDPVPCVLAQLNSSGQLVGVTASTMQAYTTGVLNAQGQSVNILNNVSTPSVAGSAFFVGYGSDGDTMINTGLNRSAVSVPGAVACQPQPPQTGWWWNPLEGGRGFSIEAQGNNLFFAAFHYEASGRATWNVSPGPVSLNGSYFTSDLYNVTGGQTLGGAYHAADAAKIGPITLSFRDASHGTMTWPGGTVPIERQNLVPGGLVALKQANVPETGWWWNPNESGRGFFIEWQKGYADIAGYMYDDLGKPTWYIAVYETPNPLTLSGNWWTFANGQSMGGTYRAATQTSSTFAPLTVTFSSSTTAVMTLPNGRTTNLVRQRF